MRIIIEDKKGYGRDARRVADADKRDRRNARREKEARRHVPYAFA
jgi:hypothetical protein